MWWGWRRQRVLRPGRGQRGRVGHVVIVLVLVVAAREERLAARRLPAFGVAARKHVVAHSRMIMSDTPFPGRKLYYNGDNCRSDCDGLESAGQVGRNEVGLFRSKGSSRLAASYFLAIDVANWERADRMTPSDRQFPSSTLS